MAGVAPVLTLAVAPDFILGSLELSFRVNREEGSTVKVRFTWAVLVAASTKAGPVYTGISMEIARIAVCTSHLPTSRAPWGCQPGIEDKRAFC